MITTTKERYALNVVLRTLKEENTTEYEEQLTTLREINKENTIEFVDEILSDKTAELFEQLKFLHRFSNLISKTFEESSQQLLLQLGELQGITLLAQELIFTKDKRKNANEKIQKHLSEKYTEIILKYLYLHPSAGHKELAEAISVKVNHLSEIMKDLIENDIVRKTRQSKYFFYSLSYQSNEYTKTKLLNGSYNRNNHYPYSPFLPRKNISYGYKNKDDDLIMINFVNTNKRYRKGYNVL